MDSPRSEARTRIETEGLGGRVKRHVAELIRLAAPIVVSRSGFLLLVMADTVMTGHVGAEELAYLTIGIAMIMPIMITSLGLIMGTLVLTANAYGADRHSECGPIWRHSIKYGLFLGLLCIGYGVIGTDLLRLTGQTGEIAVEGGEIMTIIGLGMPGHLLFLSSVFFLEGIGRPGHGMVIMLLANVLNVVLNWVMIDGTMLGEPMGAAGAAWATTISRWFMALAAMMIVWNLRDHERYRIRALPEGGFRSWQELRRIGYAIGLSIGVESLAFACLGAFAGWLGELPLAAYGLTMNLMALIFMLAIGIGSATAIRVGIATGRGDAPDAALAGWTGISVNTVLMACAGLATYLFTAEVAGIYTDEPELLAEALITLGFIVWIFIPDGGQAVMANALRGRKDVWMPTLIQTASFFGVMVPVGYLSAFNWGSGTVGLFHGILAGCIVSIALLAIRFQVLARRDIAGFQRQAAS